jgi:hypothetical protein
MSWGAVAGAAISTIGGALLSDSGGGGGGGGSGEMSAYYNEMAAGARQQREISKEQYDLYKAEVLPEVRKMMANVEMYGSEQQAIAAATGDVRDQYAAANRQQMRATELSGRNPSDPAYAMQQRTLGAMENADVAQAIRQAREQDRDRTWNRRVQAIAAYNDPVGAAGAAAQRSMAGIGNAAQLAGQNALIGLRQDAAAREQAGMLGYGIQTGIRDWRKSGGKYPWETGASGPQSSTALPTPAGGWDSPEISGMATQTGDNLTGGMEWYPYGGTADGGLIARRGGVGGVLRPRYADGGPTPRPINPMPTPMDLAQQSALARMLREMRRSDTGPGTYGGVQPRANGGEIEGPGTGTSDSIRALKAPGTYILSADTVRAVGTKKLRDLMEKAGVRPGEGENSDPRGVQVALSNGEWAMPPEATKYHGEEFFNKMQQKYHRPVFADVNEDETASAANGGVLRKRAMPRQVEDAILAQLPTRAIGMRR